VSESADGLPPEPELRRCEFAPFYREQLPVLIRFLYKQGATWEEANDIAQETFVRLYTHQRRIYQPRAWIRTVAQNLWINTRKRDGKAPILAVKGDWLPRPVTDNVELKDEEKMVYHAISQLPQRQRQVIAWCYDGYSPAEIAQHIGLSSETVRASLLQARKKLKNLLGLGEGGAA
jgi:RNA polymerase sigma-70 factor (ECF subfamily)